MEVQRAPLEFAQRHRMYMAAFNHLTPFPGTPLYERLEAEGRLPYEAWWRDPRYRYNHVPFEPRGMSGEELQKLCLSTRSRFYSLPSIARRSSENRPVNSAPAMENSSRTEPSSPSSTALPTLATAAMTTLCYGKSGMQR